MKNNLKFITISICLIFIGGNLKAQKKFEEKNGFLKVEAEDFSKQTKSDIRKWYIISDDEKSKNSSGKKYIKILPDTRKTHDDKLIKGVNFNNTPGKMAIVSYKIYINNPGRYYIWANVFSSNSEDNGVHVGLDGEWPESGQRMQWCDGKRSWYWDSKQRTKEVHCGLPGFIYLDIDKAGQHTIAFSMREDGFSMDQWFMTKDKYFTIDKLKGQPKAKQIGLIDYLNENNPKAVNIKATDFSINDNSFYIHNNWLAVNPNIHKEGKATYKYKGQSGLFDLVMHAVGENDGQSRFSVSVNNHRQGSFRPEISTKTFDEGPDYGKTFLDVQLNTNDIITVKGEIASLKGEFSRARWSGISLTAIGKGERLLQSLKQLNNKTKVSVSNKIKKWHKMTITFDGPFTSETKTFNPFMNYRLNVTFKHTKTGKSYLVPGFFAADGYAAHTSAKEGNKWRVHFSPSETGEWTYDVDFRKGNWVAVSNKLNTGFSGGFMDGARGKFTVVETDKKGKDFRAKGRLQYVGERYLKFAETGEYFLKQGPDSPENLLSYIDFDGTQGNDGHKDNLIKTWEAHEKDWIKGSPTWQEGKGKAIIGAVNYLASKGLNSISFLTNNIAGDDQNVFPYINYDTYDRIDISKMDQWEILFSHAQQKGLFLHFKMLEVENQGLLDNGGVGANTKLYFRELIARFGHHLALNWNLCEESGEWIKSHKTPPQDTSQRLAMAHYFKYNDPYHHHLVIHNGNPFDDMLGEHSGITGPSLQTNKSDFSTIHKKVLNLLKTSKEAGKQWAVAVDEPGDAQHSLVPDTDDPNHDLARKNALWGTFMAGGWGDEWYFGYKHDHSDLTCKDYRSRDLFWDQAANAIRFFKNNAVPFWEMDNKNNLVGNLKNENTVYCLAKENDTYVIYLNSVEKSSLNLTNADGCFEVLWYNPKKGGDLIKSKVKKVKGGSVVDLGISPDKKQQDWAILVRKIE